MRAPKDFDDATWDRFFDFVYDADGLTDEDVRERLAEAGIDMAPAYARLHAMLERRRDDASQ